MQRRSVPSWTYGIVAVALFLAGLPLAQGQSVPAWQPNTFYAVGAVVTHQGPTYQCRQAHTSLLGWEPPSTPALWSPVSTPPSPSPSPSASPSPVPSPSPSPSPSPTPLPGVVFADSFETDQGWRRNPGGTDTATTGLWERGDPEPTSSNGAKQLGDAFSGLNALVTGRTAGGSAGANDLDGGTTSIESPAFAVPSGGATLSFRFYLAHATNSSTADSFRVRIAGASGLATVFEELGGTEDDDAAWTAASVNLSNFAGQSIRIHFEASDSAQGSLVEAGVDEVVVTGSAGGSPPIVNLRSPASGSTFACGAPITVGADATDPDGTVTAVEFFDGSLSLGRDTTAPYSITFSTGTAGTHALTAVATDNSGRSSSSQTVTIIVNPCVGGGPLPVRVLVGYWHNFENGSGFIKLRDVSPDWDVINLAFGEPVAGSTSRIAFVPDPRTSTAEIQSDVQILHGRGKKVLLSVGGANGHVELRNATERQQFVDSVTGIIRQYGLDGLDVDFEGQSVHLDRGDADFANPTTPVIVNLISALRQIRQNIGPSFILTMAPETFFVQVGFQFYGGTTSGDQRTGAYLPVIHGVRDILTLLHVQDYNSGSVTALDGRFYAMGNADFHVAMTEMLMTGFTVANTGRFFPGLRPDQVAIGLPASVNAANGWTPAPEVQRALSYLIRGQSFGGQYVLRNPSGYRAMRGLMTWSINWDRFASFDFSRNHRAFLNALPAP